jgi:hypothetical protein
MVRNQDSLAAADAERTSLATRHRGSGHLPISNLANNVTARVCTLATWLPELLIDYPRNKRAQEMSAALADPSLVSEMKKHTSFSHNRWYAHSI